MYNDIIIKYGLKIVKNNFHGYTAADKQVLLFSKMDSMADKAIALTVRMIQKRIKDLCVLLFPAKPFHKTYQVQALNMEA